jgi:hypothetical protein
MAMARSRRGAIAQRFRRPSWCRAVGNDTLVAAVGHTGDHFVFQAGYGHDIVQGFSTAGNDVVHLESFGLGTFANLQQYLSQVGNDVLISFDVAHTSIWSEHKQCRRSESANK